MWNLFRVGNENTRGMLNILPGVSRTNFEQISHIILSVLFFSFGVDKFLRDLIKS